MATASIQKWGNSLALRIPKPLAEQAGVSAGSEVEVTATEHEIVIRPAKRRYRLKELVDGITPQNVHAETDLGPPVGKEAW
jgi:antitoxin MazE